MNNTIKTNLLSLLLFFICFSINAQVKIMTWNLMNLGKSKTTEQITYISKILNQADVIAVQEVVTNPSGAQTAAKILQELNNTSGYKWDYVISDPTISSPYRSERYLYFFKTARVKLKTKPFLDAYYQQEIEREPFLATFIYKDKEFTLVNIHALPKKHQPETEIKYFKNYPELYKNHNLIFLGDFNLPESHSVFNPLKKLGYQPSFTSQKTSLRQKCINEDCLASEYDNIFYDTAKNTLLEKKAILFFLDFNEMSTARKLSDHIPILIELEIK
ncbi:endonuclease/exonuclease/phosphatase family protein [Myroides sp. LJL119]